MFSSEIRPKNTLQVVGDGIFSYLVRYYGIWGKSCRYFGIEDPLNPPPLIRNSPALHTFHVEVGSKMKFPLDAHLLFWKSLQKFVKSNYNEWLMRDKKYSMFSQKKFPKRHPSRGSWLFDFRTFTTLLGTSWDLWNKSEKRVSKKYRPYNQRRHISIMTLFPRISDNIWQNKRHR